MSGSLKLGLYILAGVVAIYVILGLLQVVVATVLKLLVPALIIGGIAFAFYTFVLRKPLGGGRRYLP